MEFTPNDDQRTFLGVLDQIAAGPEAAWAVGTDWQRFQWSGALDAILDENGFFDCAAEPDLGPVAAAEMVMRLAELPVLVESAASALLRPRFAPDLPRPLAVVVGPAQAIRFLPVARSVIRVGTDAVEVAELPDPAAPVDSLFAYPMGRVPADLTWRKIAADPAEMLDAWRVAVAAELAGALQGGLTSVLAHVRDRRQFGRALGSFQAVQHRLAGAAARIEGGRLMTLRAAATGDPAEAARALGWLQNSATTIAYDLHQFMGAMGLTLEHPLHRWTYRARLLRSEMSGGTANLALAADRTWSTP